MRAKNLTLVLQKPLFMYVNYALYSKKFDKIYIGYTSDLVDRFHSHNTLSSKGFTSKFRPWEVVYVEFVETKKEAMKREQQLKTSAGRRFVREQVELLVLISVS